jgi:pimeloyl-ACP methyl ester carboxylesterase
MQMAIYVLVHGGTISTATWNKLTIGNPVYTHDGNLGGRCWDGTVSALKAHNHRVFAPTLKDDHTCTLTDHILQICSLMEENDVRDVILVGHSYGGMIITGVAAGMPDRIRRLVYVDAALPDPGQSLYDILMVSFSASAGSRPLLTEPAAPYVEKLQFDPVKIKPLPKTYILCSKSDFIDVTRIARQKINAAQEGWTCLELPSSHVPMADLPGDFYTLMLDAAEK